VTIEAVVELKVGFAAVTVIAGWDDIPDCGRMPLVTIHATNFGFMGTTLGGNVHGSFLVTFNAVGIAELIAGLNYIDG